MFKLDGRLDPAEAFGPSGAWPSRGMKKPDNLEELLYSGTSKEGTCGMGRAAYLRARRTLPPQSKTFTPATNSQEFGWSHTKGEPAKLIAPVYASAAKCVCPG